MRLSSQWKMGMVILFRLVFLGVMLFFFTAPLLLLELLPRSYTFVGVVVTLVYYLTVVPVVLPPVLEISGFELRSRVELDKDQAKRTEQVKAE